METKARISLEEWLIGLRMPSPPRRAGRVKSSCTISLGGTHPAMQVVAFSLLYPPWVVAEDP